MLNLNFQNGQAPALNARNMNAIVESINTLGYAVGGPNVASTVSAMTDTSKVYVYTGSETGYTAGNWYYYNGSAWVSGGVYQATAVETDTTLTMPGEAADAKATGDAVADLKNDIRPPFISVDSDDIKVNCGIKSIVPSKRIGSLNYRLGFFACGASGNNVLIAITKDCLSYADPYANRLLARLYVPKSQIPSGFQTLTVPHYNNYGDIDYEVTINCDLLKTLPTKDNTNVFLDVGYLNMMYDYKYAWENATNRIAGGIKSVPASKRSAVEGIKDIYFIVPAENEDHEFLLSTFGYSARYNRLYIRLYDATDKKEDGYVYKQYSAIPTSGIETIVFSGAEVEGTRVSGYYEYGVTIDWSKMSASNFYEQVFSDSPVVAVNMDGSRDLAKSIVATHALHGTYYLNAAITLADGQNLTGDDRGKIVCGSDAKITMGTGSAISGIEFVGPWSPVRTAGDGTTVTQYGFVPLITLQDLHSETASALFGEGASKEDALIVIPSDHAHNTIVDKCRFSGFDRPAVYAGAQRHQSVSNPIVRGNYFSDCRIGVVVGGEFIRLEANEYYRCVIGSYIHSGNDNHVGEIYKCCDCGVFFPAGSGSHDEFVSVHLCHCGLCGIYIRSIAVTLGCQLIGCHIADAAVIGEDVNAVLVSGCRLDTYFWYEGGAKNSIIGSNIRASYLYGHPLFAVPDDTQITLNRGMGVSDEDVNWE